MRLCFTRRLSDCLPVCLLPSSRKNYGKNLYEIFTSTCGQALFKFWKLCGSGCHVEIFDRFFNILQQDIFALFGSYFLEKKTNLHDNFTVDVSFDKEVPNNFLKWNTYCGFLRTPDQIGRFT